MHCGEPSRTMGGGEMSSTGALVPTVKSETPINTAGETSAPVPEKKEEEEEEVDKDMLCPICMQIIKDAFLTSCGHSYCYMCIVTHLHNKSDCPCCSHYLTTTHIFPNFLLNKLLMKRSARQMAKSASPVEQLRQAIQQGCEVSIKELQGLLSLLIDKKRKMEQEEAETNLQILLEFLQCLRKQKVEELNEIQNDLQYIKEDINAVEKHRIELHRARGRYSAKMRLLGDSSAMTVRPSLVDKGGGAIASSSVSSQEQRHAASGTSQTRKTNARAPGNAQVQLTDDNGGSDSQHPNQPGPSIARKRRVHAQFNELQACYLQKRRFWAKQSQKQGERTANVMNREGYSVGLEDFRSVLSTFTRYSRLRVVAELRHADLFHSANIVSSIEFDRDDELFATAGVSRRIKVFEFSSVVNEPADVQCPVVEMSTRSKLSCLSWNKYTKNHLASSDYEGIVTVWDVTTRQSVMEYEEHEKRAWSVDFCRTEPSMLVSGSDDCKVKVWCTKQEASVLTIDMKANICSVKYNPGSSVHVALRTFKGHTNEKNFVGLTVNSEYVACGSETNEVFVYHKEISRPAASHRFVSDDQNDPDGDMGSYFISAVCWKRDSPTILTANSQGTIKVLVLGA